MSVDLNALWDFGDPEASEQRFRAALEATEGDESLILKTQIARTYGLRRDFAAAQQILKEIEPDVRSANAEVRVRHALESGRALASATHPPDSQTEEAKEQARAAYTEAFQLARSASLDGLAIDALHMLAFVDTEPAAQLKWGLESLRIAEASSQPAAKQWEASLRNNVGYALRQLERYEEALDQFKLALAVRQRGQDAEAIRIAYWMVAWTLRALGREEEALVIQLRLEHECEVAGAPDPYVFEELEILYKNRKDITRAEAYAQRRKALK